MTWRGIQLRQERTVAQAACGPEDQIVLHTRQQMRATSLHPLHQVEGQKVPIPQQEHVFCEITQDLAGHRVFATTVRFEERLPQHMRAQLAQTEHSRLRKGTGRATASWSSERAFVGRRIGHIDDEAVHSHQPHPAIERLRRVGLRLQLDDLLRQQPQRCHPDAVTRLTQRRTCRLSENEATRETPAGNCRDKTTPSRSQTTAAAADMVPSPSTLPQRNSDSRLGHNVLQCRHPLRRGPAHRNIDILTQKTHRSLLTTWDLLHPHRHRRLRFCEAELNGIGVRRRKVSNAIRHG